MTEGIKAIFSLTDAYHIIILAVTTSPSRSPAVPYLDLTSATSVAFYIAFQPISSTRFTPCSHPSHSRKDIDYHRLFSEPLTKPGGTNSYEGYLRALQLYGQEDQLVNSHKVHRYDRWVALYPELHQSNQDQARQDGYNPSGGASSAFTGTYFPNPPQGGPSLYQGDTDPGILFPHIPQSQATSAEEQNGTFSPETSANADTMAPPRRTSRDSSGRFAASEDVFSYHTGNVKVKTGQSARNAIGATENALLLAEIFKKLIDADIPQSCVRSQLHPYIHGRYPGSHHERCRNRSLAGS
ncbi:hypothetical protein BKA60DRAFT_622969 [Fusarium oxysporum]|nr:hypothetical protein BKA60DRAFT_622969 [Fusarium oxysporum]